MRNASAGMEDWKYLVAGTTVIYSREVIYSTNYEDSANQAIFCSSGISEGLLQWQEVIHTRASFGGGQMPLGFGLPPLDMLRILFYM